jgi:spore coat assembly protein
MSEIKVGDIVSRKSYGGDNPFLVSNVIKNANGTTICILRGLQYRIVADANIDDLIKHERRDVYTKIYRDARETRMATMVRGGASPLSFLNRFRSKPGRILHVDAVDDFLDMCLKYYKDAGIRAVGHVAGESEQPEVVAGLIKRYQPDILVLTGHDGLKKNAPIKSIESYNNSRYFIKSVKEARLVEPSKDKLCIFAGACQSYYEAIMAEGANFASSPGRILIHALDPGIVSEKVALTDSKRRISPSEVIGLTKSGAEGIGGIETMGHLMRY